MTSKSIHIINDAFPTFDRQGYATRTRCGIRFREHPDTESVWPEDKKQGYVIAMDKHLLIPRGTRWCRACVRR